MDRLHCPNCNAIIEPDDLSVRFRCAYCGSDLHDAIRRYNSFYAKLPDGTVGELLRNASLYLRSHSWDDAWARANSAIDLDPTNPYGHLYRLMADTHSPYIVCLEDCEESFASLDSYRMFRRTAPPYLLAEVNMYLHEVISRLEDAETTSDCDPVEEELPDHEARRIYRQALDLSGTGSDPWEFSRAAELFAQIPHYKDSVAQKRRCEKMASALRTESHMRSLLTASAAVLVFFLAYALFTGGIL